MPGPDRIDPARIFIPASIAMLAGMAWRAGWINQATLHPLWILANVLVALLVILIVVTLPVLVVGLLIWLPVRGVIWLRAVVAGPRAGTTDP